MHGHGLPRLRQSPDASLQLEAPNSSRSHLMLATKRPVKRSSGPRSDPSGHSLLSIASRRIGSFALARPGTVALMLLFCGLGMAVSINALWMQSDRHPAPLFRQASLAPQHAVAVQKKAS